MIEYVRPDPDGVQYYVTEYKTIQYTTICLCQWPKDVYKVYKYVSTSESDGTATIVLADEAGKQYTCLLYTSYGVKLISEQEIEGTRGILER